MIKDPLQTYTDTYNAFGVAIPAPMVAEVLENKHGIDNPVIDVAIGVGGPQVSIDNDVAVFDGVEGNLIKDSGVSISTISTAVSRESYALFDHFATVGNVTTGETTLYTDTLAAGQLAANGDKLEVQYGGNYLLHATATREIKIYFGGTVIFDTGALTLASSSGWTATAMIIRVSSTVVRYMVSFETIGAALAAYTAVGEVTGLTLSNTQIVKITGQAAGAGAATNDILAKLGTIIFVPHVV